MYKLMLKFIISILALSMLFGCATNKNNDETVWNKNRLKKVTLTIYLPNQFIKYPPGYEYQMKKVIIKELEKLAAPKLNVKLEIANLEKKGAFTLVEKSAYLSILTGAPCDIYFPSSGETLTQDTEKCAKDITSLFPKYAPEYYKLFDPEELKSISYNNKLMGIPSRTIPATKRLCAVIRDDLAKKYLKDDLNSFDDFEKFLDEVKQNEPKYIPVLFDNSILEQFADSYGYNAFNPQPSSYMGLLYRKGDPEYNLISWEQTPEFRQAVNRLNQWRDKGYYKSSGPIIDYDGLTGNYASFVTENAAADRFNKLLKDSGVKSWKYKEYDLNSSSKSQRFFNPGNMVYIGPKSNNPERAIMFIEWLMSNQKAYDLLKFGIDGTDFKFKKDGTMQLLAPEGHPVEEAYAMWQSNWFLDNVFMDHQPEGYLSDRFDYIKDHTEYSAIDNLKIDFKTWSEITAKTGANIYSRRQDKRIISGDITENEIDEYILSLRYPMNNLVSQVQPIITKWNKDKTISLNNK